MPLPDPAASRAVVVGVADYEDMPSLRTVAAGVKKITELLTAPDLWGLPAEHCVVLSDPKHPGDVLDAVRVAAQQAKDTFLLYFAGHGLPSRDGGLCLMLPNADHDRLYDAVRYDDLRHVLLTECNAHSQVVILDCCFSGAAIQRYMGGPEDVADQTVVDRTYVMTACAEGKKAFAPGKERYTAFTGELVTALENGVPGGPDPLDMDTVFQHVRRALVAKGRPQPQQRATNVGHRIALVRNRAADAVAGPGTPTPPEPRTSAGRRGARLGSRRRRAIVWACVAATVLTTAGFVFLPPLLGDAPDGGSLIGSHRKADLCALTAPTALGRFGDTEQDPAYGNFDRCDVLVHRADGGVVDVVVDLDNGRPEETAGARTEGAVKILSEPTQSDRCTRLLLPTGDDVTVAVTAKYAEDGKAPLCEMADVAAEHAVAALNKGPIDRRGGDFPEDSLARQDACALLDAEALDIVPGIDANEPDPGFGSWSCDWQSTTSDLRVDLSFDRGQPLSAADGSLTWIVNRRALVVPEAEGEDTCRVQVVQRTYVDEQRETTVETLNVLVEGDRPQDDLMRMATELAASAAARLPKA